MAAITQDKSSYRGSPLTIQTSLSVSLGLIKSQGQSHAYKLLHKQSLAGVGPYLLIKPKHGLNHKSFAQMQEFALVGLVDPWLIKRLSLKCSNVTSQLKSDTTQTAILINETDFSSALRRHYPQLYIYNSMYDVRHALLVPATDLIYNQLRNTVVKAWFKTDQLSLKKKKKKISGGRTFLEDSYRLQCVGIMCICKSRRCTELQRKLVT